MKELTRKQQDIFEYLINNYANFSYPPTLDEVCVELGLNSRGSLHKHIKALIEAGLIEALDRKQTGIRLTEKAKQYMQSDDESMGTPFVGFIAAGKPIEAIEQVSYINIPDQIKTEKSCYILQIKGESMIEEGIFDGDWVIIEQRSSARNGEIVVALIDKSEATLKFIEQYPHETLLIPANSNMSAMKYKPEQVEIQGVLVGQMRSYINH
ncbi:repressor LexA [Methylococcaceae bacterium HT1]|uniref:transcriptional repressor LexA n=1 Tax=Bathymodiolus platifrons methanotrophic gill symbiont TaxID=113268 RepID=UPI000B40E815|nr:transcriptional repressor LexA [Bathymodiolus platifrons methanotrophic gill symbiont]MCK5869899.1 transcriptional repressor LexA [Methyloprofundus sp.]TXK95632.1 repressor LexA [Methylococcaceae bacterium CS5]TXK95958.1 repressor LexA [Methylococcaceae bacterium CS4]TXK98506.1 repressor LexA [Methylococcaceae bacterium HT1]TXL03876.1 repressor LexA [Methylococcaceae bacterium CS1]TXL06427.1 repressor LexA [Methylococcaceae bacterium CS3]TXL11651.1 repressor LexA [Methylococcaceae bacteri